MRLTRNQLYSLRGTGGSNPSLSAILIKKTLDEGVFFFNGVEPRRRRKLVFAEGFSLTPKQIMKKNQSLGVTVTCFVRFVAWRKSLFTNQQNGVCHKENNI